MSNADIGMIGLAVMGSNLARNMERNGFKVAVYNKEPEMLDKFMGEFGSGNFVPCKTYKELIASLKTPRKIMLMIRAGSAVDSVIEELSPLLDKGDIIIDGGNSHFPDSTRRTKMLEEKGLRFIGTGVSGGEEGALNGPSIMPGGSTSAWEHVKDIFQAIAAKTPNGEPCCDWVGENGAGHFVKMVHNGIEYGDMQLICEAYSIMKNMLGLPHDKMGNIFEDWNNGELNSFLIEITRDIMRVKDEDGSFLVENILDTAGQKGTGKWTGISALEHGVPLTLIGEAVFARCLSAMKEERVEASKVLTSKAKVFSGDVNAFVKSLGEALYASKIVSYAQGYVLMRAAAKEYGWNLNYGGIALMWRGGCIIRSAFLSKIKEAFDKNKNLSNLLLSPFFAEKINNAESSLREVVSESIKAGVSIPAFASALTYFDGYRSESLPANLLQAQRDYFGAHTYERKDKTRGEFFHTNWTGRGGDISSSTYNA